MRERLGQSLLARSPLVESSRISKFPRQPEIILDTNVLYRIQQATTEKGPREMSALLFLAAFIVFVELAAIRGWGVDSRDGRDWNVGELTAARA